MNPKNILFKSILACVAYLFIYHFANIDFIKENSEDFAFDTTLEVTRNIELVTGMNLFATKDPKPLLLLIVDDEYLKSAGIPDDGGYLFPRAELAKILKSIQKRNSSLQKPIKSVFIDYDLTHTSEPYGKVLNGQDRELIKTISMIDEFNIGIIQGQSVNFIAQNLQKENLISVSAHMHISDDYNTRRWKPYLSFESDEKKSYYPAFSFVAWLLADEKCTPKSIREATPKDDSFLVCGYELDEFDTVSSRIINKPTHQDPITGGKALNWDNTHLFSATFALEDIAPELLEGATIFIGADYKKSSDIFHTPNFYASLSDIAGLYVHTNVFKTLEWSGGSLKKMNIYYSLVLTLVMFVIFSYFEDRFLANDRINYLVSFVGFALIMLVIMFVLSLFLLLYFKVWYNWVIPMVLIQILEVIEKLSSAKNKIRVLGKNKK